MIKYFYVAFLINTIVTHLVNYEFDLSDPVPKIANKIASTTIIVGLRLWFMMRNANIILIGWA